MPARHDGYPELPFVFAGSAATAAAGLVLLAAPPDQNAPARNLGLLGAGLELAAFRTMIRRIGMTAEPNHRGRGGAYLRAGEALTVLGAAGSLAGSHRLLGKLSGAALLAASAGTPVGHLPRGAGIGPRPEVHGIPQRQRLGHRASPPSRDGSPVGKQQREQRSDRPYALVPQGLVQGLRTRP
jgi:hypothetical protein